MCLKKRSDIANPVKTPPKLLPAVDRHDDEGIFGRHRLHYASVQLDRTRSPPQTLVIDIERHLLRDQSRVRLNAETGLGEDDLLPLNEMDGSELVFGQRHARASELAEGLDCLIEIGGENNDVEIGDGPDSEIVIR